MKPVASCVFLSLALAGCESSGPRFYTLERVVGPSEVTNAATIEVGRPGLAGYLDRSEIVLKNDAYRVSTSERDRWAEPLGDMIGRVLTQNLSQRLKNTSVYDQSGAITAAPDARVEVNIVSLNADESGSMTLNADVAIEQGGTHHAMASRRIALQTSAPGSDPEALVATMSNLLGTLSDRIASDVHSSTALAAAAAAPTPVATADPPPGNIPVANANVAMAANTPVATVIPLSISPAPVASVAEKPLPPADCESGGRAVPCLHAP
jgi:uncharacterized lipoprotein YmbA